MFLPFAWFEVSLSEHRLLVEKEITTTNFELEDKVGVIIDSKDLEKALALLDKQVCYAKQSSHSWLIRLVLAKRLASPEISRDGSCKANRFSVQGQGKREAFIRMMLGFRNRSSRGIADRVEQAEQRLAAIDISIAHSALYWHACQSHLASDSSDLWRTEELLVNPYIDRVYTQVEKYLLAYTKPLTCRDLEGNTISLGSFLITLFIEDPWPNPRVRFCGTSEENKEGTNIAPTVNSQNSLACSLQQNRISNLSKAGLYIPAVAMAISHLQIVTAADSAYPNFQQRLTAKRS